MNALVPHSCINCGISLNRFHRLCEACFFMLNKNWRAGNSIFDSKYSIFCLYNWIPGASNTLSTLHTELKTAHFQTFKMFSEQMAQELLVNQKDFSIPTDTLVVSIESSKGHQHGENWGRAIAQEFQLEHVTALRKKRTEHHRGKQRELSREQRQSIELELCEDLTDCCSRPILFADDIITTGATLNEAYRKLGQPKEFLALFISHRKRT